MARVRGAARVRRVRRMRRRIVFCLFGEEIGENLGVLLVMRHWMEMVDFWVCERQRAKLQNLSLQASRRKERKEKARLVEAKKEKRKMAVFKAGLRTVS